MTQKIAHVTLVVRNYDEAINFYVNKLHFNLLEDTPLDGDKRWVIVSPTGINSCSLLLAKAANKYQEKYIGDQSGGRVFLFLYTDNFERDYQNLIENSITIVRERTDEPYGIVAVFKDLYGNLWDLIQKK